MTEQTKMPGLEIEVDDVVVMEQDETLSSSSTRHHASASASASTAASSSFPSSSTRRSTRTAGAPSGGGRRAGAGSRGMSNFNEMDRQIGRGSRNEDGRQGTEQNIWDKVLDKNGGYQGMLTFDPFQELIESHSRRSTEATQQVNAQAAASLASPSA